MHYLFVPDPTARAETLNELEQQMVSLCADGVRAAGLPKSIGEIYGLLIVSPEPLSLCDLVGRIQISKGSASQGLKALLALGAIREVEGRDTRRTYFEANINLKKLVRGFIREQVRPHIENGQTKLKAIEALAKEEEDEEMKEFYLHRIGRMQQWTKQARIVLPLLQRVLGD